MSNSGANGARVATAIGAIKWVLIALAITAGAVSILAAVLRGGNGAITISLAAAAGTAVWSLFVWVLFGWFEHTLSTLAEIARNTAPAFQGQPSFTVPPSYEPRR